jgi:cytochrome b561
MYSHEPHWVQARQEMGLWIKGDPPLPPRPKVVPPPPPKPRGKPSFAECVFYLLCFVVAIVGIVWMIFAALFAHPFTAIIWTIFICAIFSIGRQLKTGKISNKW